MKGRLQAFLRDEGGQATIEYLLILSIVATFLLMAVTKLIRPAFSKLNSYITNSIEKKFFGGDLHHFPVRR